MGFMDKLKNIFFEEEEDEEVEDEKVKQDQEVVIKKVEIPKRVKEEKNETVEIKPVNKEVIEPKREKRQQELIFDDEDFVLDTKKVVKKEVKKEEKIEPPKKEVNIKPPITKTEYYKKEEVKKTFTPSPIISPIYGILDKNYKKEEVKEKKEIHISARPAKMDFDSVRNKAFGDLENELFPPTEEKETKKKEVKPRDFNRVYDTTKDKPEIDKVTLGEADEFFNDLGLAYNTDYKDISKEINDGKIPQEKKEKKEATLEDNIFDLIESMYDKED